MAKIDRKRQRAKDSGGSFQARPQRPPSRGFGAQVAAHPVRWAVIGYALLTVIVFAGPIFTPGEMVYGTDTMSAGVFFRSFHAEFWRDHMRMPMWNPYIHAGLPFVDAMHGDIFYPAAILQILLPVPYALGIKLILHVFLAGVFMFLFLRVIGRSDPAAFVGGLLYMFAPFIVSLFFPGHDGKIYVTALTPLAFLALYRAVVTRRLPVFLGFGLVYALLILTAHVQMAYYAAWGLGLYFVFLLWERYRFAPRQVVSLLALFVLAVGLSLGATAVQWVTPYKYTAKYSQRLLQQDEERGYEWSSSWSMNSEEVLSEINPEFPGADLATRRQSTYWGQNPFKLNSEAVGVMAVMLALVALITLRIHSVIFFAVLSLLALLYAVGSSTPVFHLFYSLVPMVKKFRAPSMIVFLFGFCWVVMAAFALDALRRDPSVPKPRGSSIDPFRVLRIIAIAYSAIAIIALLIGSSLLTGWASLIGRVLTQRQAASLQDNVSAVSSGFIVGSVVLWALVGLFHMQRRSALGPSAMLAGLAILAVIPNWMFNARFVETINPDPIYGEAPILDLIRQHAPNEPFRVLNLRGIGAGGELEDNYLALHGIEELSPTAMHGNHLLTNDVFTGRHDPQPALINNDATRNLLNSVMIVAPGRVGYQGLEPLGQAGGLYLYRNTEAMPRAAVFYQYEVISDTNAALSRIRSDGFPYRSRLILDQELPGIPPVSESDTLAGVTPARVVEWDVDRFIVVCTTSQAGILWLSENHYPAWRATDEAGQSLPIYRADYAFRAVPLRPGPHRVTFEFYSESYAKARWLSLACSLLLVCGGIVSLRSGRKPTMPAAAG